MTTRAGLRETMKIRLLPSVVRVAPGCRSRAGQEKARVNKHPGLFVMNPKVQALLLAQLIVLYRYRLLTLPQLASSVATTQSPLIVATGMSGPPVD